MDDHKVAIVGFFKDAESAAAKNFKSVAGETDDQVGIRLGGALKRLQLN